MNELLRAYQRGLGYKLGDVLRPRKDAKPVTFGCKDDLVTVLEQSCLAPHKYTVVGENPSPRQPSDRFVKFEINGHDWERAP